MSQCQQRPVCHLKQSGFWWIYPDKNMEIIFLGFIMHCCALLGFYFHFLSEVCQSKVILTNLEELSFLMVFALPKASRAGLHWMIWSSRVPWRETPISVIIAFMMMLCNVYHTQYSTCFSFTTFLSLVSFFAPPAATLAKYWMTLFVFTVFPAPDSPLQGNGEELQNSLFCDRDLEIETICISNLRDQDGLILSV